jgi:hypothetical protein
VVHGGYGFLDGDTQLPRPDALPATVATPAAVPQ